MTWKSARPAAPTQREREPDDLDVGGEVALAQQLGADLQHLARPAAALRLLPKHLAGVAQPERPSALGEGRRGHPREAGGEIVAEREDPAVAVGKAHQPLGHAGPAGADEGVLVLEGRRDQLLVAGALQRLQRGALQRAAAADGLAGEVERAGRKRGDWPDESSV